MTEIRIKSDRIRVGPVVGLNLLGLCIQPLDFYFNRQRKLIARRIFDYIQLDNIAINLSERNNIIHLNFLIHNQLSLSLFMPMIKYSWFAASYVDQHPRIFESFNEVCFNVNGSFCQQSTCHLLSFIQCSYCLKFLCFKHLFEAYHYHALVFSLVLDRNIPNITSSTEKKLNV